MVSINVEFDGAAYSLASLNAAAYRLIGIASCRIETAGDRVVCHLLPVNPTEDSLKLVGLLTDLANDEQLRERLAAQTQPVRDLILSLAFGALASETSAKV
ncbi:MAG: hypothetical protein K5821_11720 [Nitrobacter sp.]|uniref:hypothetical protein n=1 Tax=Nitrobacter sp. TaxID=29420 RepID=UPI002635DF63|nr:hypothetical protein [Nitrobacter sp.]MCV0387083.1 hypothetical protein [Nitrobacter sp.]